MRTARTRFSTLLPLAVAGAALISLSSCGGSSGKDKGGGTGSELRLQSVSFGRLVDVFAYRRIDPQRGQRRDALNRVAVKVAENVVVDPRIESEPLFDPVGEEDPNADFQFRPFDVVVGHEELLVLWDDSHPDEVARFEAAMSRAQSGLVPVPAAVESQNTIVQPIPVVPRNAALKLQFTRPVGVADGFFAANPAALQVLEIVDDPGTTNPQRAFRTVPYRVLAQDDALIVDPSLIGGESRSAGGRSASGLPVSPNSIAANIRVAIPTQLPGGGLGVKSDRVAELNGIDRTGLPAVIRDFRTGNAADGRTGTMIDVDRPLVVADVPMGITEIDVGNRILTLNKRYSQVAVRGAIPFVLGPLNPVTRVPLGPAEVPTISPLRSGDFIEQTVATPTGSVRVRAEVLMNLDVSNEGTLSSNPNLGRAADGSDGGSADTVHVLVSNLSVTDEAGNAVAFRASSLPLGADCTVRVHYYNYVPYTSGSLAVTDESRRLEFVIFDPAPPRIDPQTRQVIPLGTRIAPEAAVMVRTSEPIDLTTVDHAGNLLLANRYLPDSALIEVLTAPKPTSLSLVGTSFEDFQQDGTVLRLNLPMGHSHVAAQEETYWLHLLADDPGPRDLAGLAVDLFDRRFGVDQKKSFSVSYKIDPNADENLVASRVIRFASQDEDGTKPGAPDFFGQFELRDGKLFGAAVTRFSRVADVQTLGGVIRGDKGDCFDPGSETSMPPRDASHLVWGPLYTTPSMVQSTAPAPPPDPFQPPATPISYGGIGGPHNPRGHREQVTYREDDFQLGYTDASTMMIDVEQMHWSPWTNQAVLFDQFDRYTLRMGHAHKRADLRTEFVPPAPGGNPDCGVTCASLVSGLSTTFAANALNGVMVEVVKDSVYTINPGDAFRSTTDNVFTPYPKFQRTFTWRDPRLVSWDRNTNEATGLGGAQNATANTIPPRDDTTNVSSPWEQDLPQRGFVGGQNNVEVPAPSGIEVMDPGDFWGDRTGDTHPIALPLLMEFNLWPDDPGVNGVVKGVNKMHIGFVGHNDSHQSPFWGYYNLGKVPNPLVSPTPHWARQFDINGRPGACGGDDYPAFTVHTGGYIDRGGVEFKIDPTLALQARGSLILDAGSTDQQYGLTQVPAANDHLYWAQADFVRRVSMVQFGFFDPLKPNQHALDATNVRVNWPGLNDPEGLPNLSAVPERRVQDMVAVMDPPLEKQPVGTSVVLEVNGAESFANDGLWSVNTGQSRPNQEMNWSINRQNLLNPLYASDCYRYAMSNPGLTQTEPRVAATGLTPFADLENLAALRNQLTGLLPRYLSFRLIMEADINRSAPKVPSLDSLVLVWRVQTP